MKPLVPIVVTAATTLLVLTACQKKTDGATPDAAAENPAAPDGPTAGSATPPVAVGDNTNEPGTAGPGPSASDAGAMKPVEPGAAPRVNPPEGAPAPK